MYTLRKILVEIKMADKLSCTAKWLDSLGCIRIENQCVLRIPGSSTVEHSAVNRRVASSNLARGANFSVFNELEYGRAFGSLPNDYGRIGATA